MNKKKIFSILLLCLILTAPILVSAQAQGGCGDTNESLKCLIISFGDLIANYIIPLLFLGVFAMFLYGVMNYVMHGGDKMKRKEGLQFMVWGIVALTVMFSVWGLVILLKGTFNLSDTPTIAPPTVSFPTD